MLSTGHSSTHVPSAPPLNSGADLRCSPPVEFASCRFSPLARLPLVPVRISIDTGVVSSSTRLPGPPSSPHPPLRPSSTRRYAAHLLRFDHAALTCRPSHHQILFIFPPFPTTRSCCFRPLATYPLHPQPPRRHTAPSQHALGAVTTPPAAVLSLTAAVAAVRPHSLTKHQLSPQPPLERRAPLSPPTSPTHILPCWAMFRGTLGHDSPPSHHHLTPLDRLPHHNIAPPP